MQNKNILQYLTERRLSSQALSTPNPEITLSEKGRVSLQMVLIPNLDFRMRVLLKDFRVLNSHKIREYILSSENKVY